MSGDELPVGDVALGAPVAVRDVQRDDTEPSGIAAPYPLPEPARDLLVEIEAERQRVDVPGARVGQAPVDPYRPHAWPCPARSGPIHRSALDSNARSNGGRSAADPPPRLAHTERQRCSTSMSPSVSASSCPVSTARLSASQAVRSSAWSASTACS